MANELCGKNACSKDVYGKDAYDKNTGPVKIAPVWPDFKPPTSLLPTRCGEGMNDQSLQALLSWLQHTTVPELRNQKHLGRGP